MVGIPAVLLTVCVLFTPGRRAAPCLALAGLVLACSDRQHRNPFDPMVENPIDTVTALEATAGDRRVTLSWDYTYFEDLVGLRIYRRTSGSGESAVDLASGQTSWEDNDVENGTVYEYRLGLVIAGEGERDSGVLERATPGTAAAWVADPGSGLVWRLAPDGRSSVFAQGRFAFLTSIAVTGGDRACWVGDRRFGGLYRIDREGELQVVPGELEGVEEFAAAADGLGWMIEADGDRVWWADLSTASDSLRLTAVDAHFEEPSALAAALDACWIVDSAEPRVLLYHRDGTRIDAWTGLDAPGAIATSTASEGGDDDGQALPFRGLGADRGGQPPCPAGGQAPGRWRSSFRSHPLSPSKSTRPPGTAGSWASTPSPPSGGTATFAYIGRVFRWGKDGISMSTPSTGSSG